MVAPTYFRRLEAAGIKHTAADVMDDMRHLHSVLMLPAEAYKPRRRLETPSKTQAEVLTAPGRRVDNSGVLRKGER